MTPSASPAGSPEALYDEARDRYAKAVLSNASEAEIGAVAHIAIRAADALRRSVGAEGRENDRLPEMADALLAAAGGYIAARDALVDAVTRDAGSGASASREPSPDKLPMKPSEAAKEAAYRVLTGRTDSALIDGDARRTKGWRRVCVMLEAAYRVDAPLSERPATAFLQRCTCLPFNSDPMGFDSRCPIHGEPQLGTLTTSHKAGDPIVTVDMRGSERGASGAAPTDTALSGQVVLRSHAWPLRDVLTRLADAADHLLIGHDCDLHGWEEVGTARDRARELVGELAELQAKSLTKPERAPADQITLTEVVRLALEDAPCIECGGTGANNSGFACSFGCASSSEPAPADLTALFTRKPQQVYAAKKLYRELVDDRSCYGGPEGMTPSDRAIITAALHFYVFGFAEPAPAASSTALTDMTLPGLMRHHADRGIGDEIAGVLRRAATEIELVRGERDRQYEENVARIAAQATAENALARCRDWLRANGRHADEQRYFFNGAKWKDGDEARCTCGLAALLSSEASPTSTDDYCPGAGEHDWTGNSLGGATCLRCRKSTSPTSTRKGVSHD